MIYEILGYLGAILIVLHLGYHYYNTIILKKKIMPAKWELWLLGIFAHLMLLIYAFGIQSYPFFLFFSATLLFNVSGVWKKKKNKKIKQ